ncbi:MAG: 3-isopropylmalate dehydratase small subunit [Gammaproteobacteria bacterium]|nr:3-isopropylmalate dehydratase small subunit [Gammaproteobacteria bacterium]MDH5303052.1 3-isopropylmalate dehydratase small subunit [Gammaproteobacteria bacterium]MDH5321214.1 3-isopropylmalate dehydratase small subunit [Gammaproteobacteria bacterium]
MQPMSQLRSRTVVLATRDIDTDQIIPARFLTATSRAGFGAQLFYDLRFNKDGSPNVEFALNQPGADGCEVLVAGNNFGCGSSREHAVWALLDYGIRAVISTGIADIFRNNGLKNGLLPIVVDAETHQWLLQHPGTEVAIDVARATLQFAGDRCVEFPIDQFARYCLLEGIDQLGFLRQRLPDIELYERHRTWTP